MHFVDILVAIVSILLIVLVMMQSSKDDIKDAFSGEKSDLFKNQKTRGFDRFLKISTAVVGTLFIVLVVVSRVIIR